MNTLATSNRLASPKLEERRPGPASPKLEERRPGPASPTLQERRPGFARPISLADVLDRVLTKGAVVVGEVVISLAGVDLVYLGLNLVLASVETVNAQPCCDR